MTILEFLTTLDKEICDKFENYESKNDIPDEIFESMENVTLMLHAYESGDISEETHAGLKHLVTTLQENDPFSFWRLDVSTLMELSDKLSDLYVQNECEK